LKIRNRDYGEKGTKHHWIDSMLQGVPDLSSRGDAGHRLFEIFSGKRSYGVHLAVFVEPYLSLIFDGKKTIESRFNSAKHPPFEQVCAGDVIVLKRSSGPICGICLVSNVWFYRLDPKSWSEIETFASAICMDDSPFWAKKKKVSSFATLMRIEAVTRIPDIQIDKFDPRSWVVLSPAADQLRGHLL
jgi:hypothetical protein